MEIKESGVPEALEMGIKGAIDAFERQKENLQDVQNVPADGGYTGEARQEVKNLCRCHSGDCKALRTAYIRGSPETVGG